MHKKENLKSTDSTSKRKPTPQQNETPIFTRTITKPNPKKESQKTGEKISKHRNNKKKTIQKSRKKGNPEVPTDSKRVVSVETDSAAILT